MRVQHLKSLDNRLSSMNTFMKANFEISCCDNNHMHALMVPAAALAIICVSSQQFGLVICEAS